MIHAEVVDGHTHGSECWWSVAGPQRVQSENAESDNREHEHAAEIVQRKCQHERRQHRQHDEDESASACPVCMCLQPATGEPAGDGEHKPDAGDDGKSAEEKLPQRPEETTECADGFPPA